jgi:hypothetical protein
MTGDRVKEQYYHNWTYKDSDGLWYFIDNRRFIDHGPFDSYEKACRGIDDYLRRSMDDHNKESAVVKEG